MAPAMNTLAGLVLLAAVKASAAAGTASRSLQFSTTINTEYVVETGNATEYIIDINTEAEATVEILSPSDALMTFDSAGQMTELTINSTVYEIEDGEPTETDRRSRRTQQKTSPAERSLQATTQEEGECREECVFIAEAICDVMLNACVAFDQLGALLEDAGVCADLDLLCAEDGIEANCINQCSQSCEPDFPDDCPDNEICCPVLRVCEIPNTIGACGDPHMTGFLGQKFDFTGEDGAWYALLEDGPSMHLNMRVNTALPSLPEVTYITGLTVATVDFDGVHHTVEIEVNDPHSLESACPEGVSPCLAEGALTVKVDGKDALAAPGTVNLGPGVAVSAVNLPGACRSFGFEKYWELKKLQNAAAGRRRLGAVDALIDMGEWILGDPTATNMEECMQYVDEAGDLFAHDSEHASFQILTPLGTVRLTHGRLHQVATRDPTNRFDIPDHRTWQMNVALDHHDVSMEASGVLGETVSPTYDSVGNPIMKGMKAIRGSEEDYRVAGSLETVFAQN